MISTIGCEEECGDGFCSPNEEGRCSQDCYCGDEICASNETYRTCGTDCPAPEPDPSQCNRDTVCDSNENSNTCPSDCPRPTNSCGNYDCEPELNETIFNCTMDCGWCGDGRCMSGENIQNCRQDCNSCGNGRCDSGETSENCSQDCGCPAHLPYVCGGTCWGCPFGNFISCCNGVAFTCGDSRYPFACPSFSTCYSTLDAFFAECPDAFQCNDWGRRC